MKYLLKFSGIFLAFLIQSTMLENIRIFNCSPDLLAISVIICAVSSEFIPASVLGAFAGVLVDALQGRVFGINVLIYMYTALIVSVMVEKNTENSPLIMSWVCFVSITLLETALALMKTMLGYRQTLGYLGANIFVKGLFGALFTVVFVMVYQHIKNKKNKKLETIEEEAV